MGKIIAVPHFNSIKVRLKLMTTISSGLTMTFQFHKGTIKTSNWSRFAYNGLYFKSIKVRLKLPNRKGNERRVRHFNSIKVRLKLSVFPFQLHISNIFQFHKGTIKTPNEVKLLWQCQEFQFHKGTIKTKIPVQPHCRNQISIP